MKIDTVTMFTSEIKVVEINTLSDELTLVIPETLEVYTVTHQHGQSLITLRQVPETPGFFEQVLVEGP